MSLFHVLFRNFAFNGRGLSGRPVHLQERQHLLRSLRHQVLQHLIVSKLTRFSPPREGRATMVSAFASFKFGVAFCFTQLISVLMVFYVSTPCHRHEILFCNLHQSRQGQKTTIVQVEIIDKLYLAIPTRYKSKALINTILHFLTRLAPSPPTTNTWWSTLALR